MGWFGTNYTEKLFNLLDGYIPRLHGTLLSIELRLSSIEKILKKFEFCSSSPGPISIKLITEIHKELTMDIIIYDVNLPSLPDLTDVVNRELSINVITPNGETNSDVITVERNVVLIPGLEAVQDSEVTLSLVDIDDSGNRSQPSVYKFKAIDVIAPPVPGDFGVIIVDEKILPSPIVEE